MKKLYILVVCMFLLVSCTGQLKRSNGRPFVLPDCVTPTPMNQAVKPACVTPTP